MFRFLIVEDILPTLEQLSKLLDEEFPDCTIHKAQTVAEGDALLLTAQRENHPYDVAILDFKLPAVEGENAEIDETLCLTVRRTSPGTLVIHMTAFEKDPVVIDHLRKVHKPPGPWAFLVSKRESGWARGLLQNLRTFLFSREIAQQMDDLFGSGPGAVAINERFSRSQVRRGGGTTHRLAALTRSIAMHWTDLDENLKESIQGRFEVEPTEGSLRVSLR